MTEIATHLKGLVRFHCNAAKSPTPISGLTLFRSDRRSQPVRSLYTPRICVVLQGRKQIDVEKSKITIEPGQFLVIGLDLPVSASVVTATPAEPHLALTIDLEPAIIAELALTAVDTPSTDQLRGAAIAKLNPDLLEAIERLVRLLDRPADIPVLAPLLQREIFYRLLHSELGDMLRQYGTTGSKLNRISAAAAWIKQNFEKPLEVANLAEHAGMSVTSFHRAFKAATHMSPLQFRSRLRLHEARRRLSLGEQHIGTIAFDVGYRSQSQFNREYRKMFGNAPGQDHSV